MKEQFVPYDIAIKLEEKGFNEECLGFYYQGQFYPESQRCAILITWDKGTTIIQPSIKAPLWQQVFDWLREKHKLSIEIYNYNNSFGYIWMVKKVDGIYSSGFPEVESTDEVEYQVARIDAIQATLTLI